MNKVIEYIIGAKDATGNAIKSALSRLKSFASSVGSNLMNIKAGFEMLGSAANKAMDFMRKAFAFETMTVQFKTLIGNMDEARDHMKMLQELGDTPPFSLEEFAAASRALMVMTDGALGFRSSLELIGDAAAATGQPIQNLAHEVGRAYAIIRDGQPLTRATMSLRNMGVLTPEVAQKLQDLQDAGADNVRIWEELEAALNRYKGAMEETEQTGEGLIGAIQAQWDDTLREFGAACLETAKDGLGALLDTMKQLREDGSVAVWADETVGAIEKVGGAISKIKGLFDYLFGTGKQNTQNTFMAALGGLGAGVANADEFGGGWRGFRKAQAAYLATHAANERVADANAKRLNSMMREDGEWDADIDIRKVAAEDEKAHEADVRQRAKERQADDAAKKEQKRIEEAAKIKASLEEGQRKIDERNAEADAKKYAEEYAKWEKQVADQEERDRIEAERAIAAERQRLWNEDMKQRQADLTAAQAAEADAQAALSAAQSDEARAWGWYRNKDQWKAQLEEEKANAEAEAQFEKDFEHLKRFRKGWRTNTNLSEDEEIVRRVGLAREGREQAEMFARQTAQECARAADALESIEQAITEGSAE